MLITPINNFNIAKTQTPVINFQGKKQSQENNSDYSSNIPKKTVIPAAIFLMSLSPSLLNAAQQDNYTEEPTSLVELAPSEVKVSNELPYYLKDENLRYSKEFEMDGKNYTIYYSDIGKNKIKENRVVDIYIAPDDFQLVKKHGLEKNSPMKVLGIVYHRQTENQQNFVGAIISENRCDENGENETRITKEIKLPQEIGNDLMDLYFGKTEFHLAPNRIQIEATNSSELKEEQEVLPKMATLYED